MIFGDLLIIFRVEMEIISMVYLHRFWIREVWRVILQPGLIVSVQLFPEDPVYEDGFFRGMVKSALQEQIAGIRTESAKYVRIVREMTQLPVIGLSKDRTFEAFITPTTQHIQGIVEAGAHIIAIDCTQTSRPQPVEHLFRYIRDQFPTVEIMADISSVEDAQKIHPLDPDYFATTLSGYTHYTTHVQQPDFSLIEQLIAHYPKIPIIAEGNIWTPEQAQKAMRMGAYAVTVGSAITRPWLITRRFVHAMRDQRELNGE